MLTHTTPHQVKSLKPCVGTDAARADERRETELNDSSKGGAVSYRSLQADGQAELERAMGRRPDGRVDWDARWHTAAAWCQEHLPDLVDNRGVTCGFAVGSALRLRSELQRLPKPEQVRAHRAAWMRRLGLGDAI